MYNDVVHIFRKRFRNIRIHMNWQNENQLRTHFTILENIIDLIMCILGNVHLPI